MKILLKRLDILGACKVFFVTKDVEMPLRDLKILRRSIGLQRLFECAREDLVFS